MSAPSRGLGPEARLTSRGDFGKVFSQGRRVSGRSLILWYRGSAAPRGARLGLSVSAKVGTAVRRNRLKRLAREAFRHHRARLEPGADIVVCLRPGCRWDGLAQAEADILELCGRAGLIK